MRVKSFSVGEHLLMTVEIDFCWACTNQCYAPSHIKRTPSFDILCPIVEVFRQLHLRAPHRH